MKEKKKSIDRREYKVVLKELRAVRRNANLSQVELAALLERPQTFVSAAEVGKKRLDLLQLQDWARCCSTDIVAISQRVYDALPRSLKTRSKRNDRIRQG